MTIEHGSRFMGVLARSAIAFAVIRASSERYSGSASSARASSAIGASAGVNRAIAPVRSSRIRATRWVLRRGRRRSPTRTTTLPRAPRSTDVANTNRPSADHTGSALVGQPDDRRAASRSPPSRGISHSSLSSMPRVLGRSRERDLRAVGRQRRRGIARAVGQSRRSCRRVRALRDDSRPVPSHAA